MRGDRGFTLLEVLVSAAVLAVVAMAMVLGAVTTHSSARTLDRKTTLRGQAEGYVERLMAMTHGSPADGAATASELSELFDDDDDLGTATLHGLRAFGPAQFTIPSSGHPLQWRIEVSDDLDGDGDTDGAAEGRGDLLRISVLYDGRLVSRARRFEALAAP